MTDPNDQAPKKKRPQCVPKVSANASNTAWWKTDISSVPIDDEKINTLLNSVTSADITTFYNQCVGHKLPTSLGSLQTNTEPTFTFYANVMRSGTATVEYIQEKLLHHLPTDPQNVSSHMDAVTLVAAIFAKALDLGADPKDVAAGEIWYTQASQVST